AQYCGKVDCLRRGRASSLVRAADKAYRTAMRVGCNELAAKIAQVCFISKEPRLRRASLLPEALAATEAPQVSTLDFAPDAEFSVCSAPAVGWITYVARDGRVSIEGGQPRRDGAS